MRDCEADYAVWTYGKCLVDERISTEETGRVYHSREENEPRILTFFCDAICTFCIMMNGKMIRIISVRMLKTATG